jgi:heme-degrading monooxygenase HmoA
MDVILVLFRSRLNATAGADYHEMAEEMLATAREMPGFIDFKTYVAVDGERISVVRWQDLETMRLWREHPRHMIAQENGRTRWYEWYQIDVAELIRGSEFKAG